MARHRRDDQQFRPTVDALTHEMLELAERFAALDRLAHRDSFAVDRRRREAEIGLAARRRGMGEHFKRRPHHLPPNDTADGIGGLFEHFYADTHPPAAPDQ